FVPLFVGRLLGIVVARGIGCIGGILGIQKIFGRLLVGGSGLRVRIAGIEGLLRHLKVLGLILGKLLGRSAEEGVVGNLQQRGFQTQAASDCVAHREKTEGY